MKKQTKAEYDKQRHKEWKLNNVLRVSEYGKEYYKKNREKILAYGKEYSKTPHKIRYQENHKLLKKYGISIEQRDQIIECQHGLCPICNKPLMNKSGIFVDHNHDTGKVRGVLCRKCNLAIGLLGEDVETLERGFQYLMYELVHSNTK